MDKTSDMSKFHFEEINAFTQQGRPALGNPASICLVDHFPHVDVMGQAAKALGTAMTTFISPTGDENVYDIRHFSPDGMENHVCGHATIAAAEFLARQDPALRQGHEIVFKLNPVYGINQDNAFKARIQGHDISLTVPAILDMREMTDPEFYKLLTEALRIDADDIDGAVYYAPRILNYVVAFKDEDTFMHMSPDFEKLKKLAVSDDYKHEGIMATFASAANGTINDAENEFDIMTRVFLPIIGVDEDVACGSANCSVIPYWTMKRKGVFPDDKTEFKAIFPYPPEMANGMEGGLQTLQINHEDEEIILTGQATFKKSYDLAVTPQKAPSPKP